MPITFGILTVSDSCSMRQKVDTAGEALQECIATHCKEGIVIAAECVPDDKDAIKRMLIAWCDAMHCNIIFTTGGTGFAPRDVTPEATREVVDKLAPAIIQRITSESLQITPFAMLSRAVCGIRNRSLILNMPGSRKAVVECFQFIQPILKHAVDVLTNDSAAIADIHEPVNWTSKVQIPCVALRSRKSPFPMVAVSEALTSVLSEVDTFNKIFDATETIPIQISLDRVLAADVYSAIPLPPFPASIKDGYAVIAADGPGVRKVKDAVAAGDSLTECILRNGEIMRISTGAPIPAGADAVVQVEDTELVTASTDNSKELEVRINVVPTVGLDIRAMGSDMPENSLAMRKGDIITPAHIGVLAAIGLAEVNVNSRFSVGIVSSGNELQVHGQPLRSGHIYDSNKLTLSNLLKQHGYIGVDCGIAKDDANSIKGLMIRAFAKHDVLITSGGVSMGEYDLMKQVLVEDFGANIHFGRVDMKPGKPTTFATCMYNRRMKLIFGLPGNPVSASVTCLLFVIPALQRKEGKPTEGHRIKVILDVDVTLDARPEFMRATITRRADGKFYAVPTGNQISSKLNSFLDANALLILPKRDGNVSHFVKGATIEAIKFD